MSDLEVSNSIDLQNELIDDYNALFSEKLLNLDVNVLAKKNLAYLPLRRILIKKFIANKIDCPLEALNLFAKIEPEHEDVRDYDWFTMQLHVANLGAFDILRGFWKYSASPSEPKDVTPLEKFSEKDYKAAVTEYFRKVNEIFGPERKTEVDLSNRAFNTELFIKNKQERNLRFFELHQRYHDVRYGLNPVLITLTELYRKPHKVMAEVSMQELQDIDLDVPPVVEASPTAVVAPTIPEPVAGTTNGQKKRGTSAGASKVPFGSPPPVAVPQSTNDGSSGKKRLVTAAPAATTASSSSTSAASNTTTTVPAAPTATKSSTVVVFPPNATVNLRDLTQEVNQIRDKYEKIDPLIEAIGEPSTPTSTTTKPRGGVKRKPAVPPKRPAPIPEAPGTDQTDKQAKKQRHSIIDTRESAQQISFEEDEEMEEEIAPEKAISKPLTTEKKKHSKTTTTTATTTTHPSSTASPKQPQQAMARAAKKKSAKDELESITDDEIHDQGNHQTSHQKSTVNIENIEDTDSTGESVDSDEEFDEDDEANDILRKGLFKAKHLKPSNVSPMVKVEASKAKTHAMNAAGRVRWTIEEEELLLAAVAKHGAGNWRQILDDPEYRYTFRHRTNVHLKDKYRNILKNQ